MKIKFKLPIKVQVDNKGDIFISKNPTLNIKKNIYTRYHFIHKYFKDEIIEIELFQNKKIIKNEKNFSKYNHHFKCKDIINEVNIEQGYCVRNIVPNNHFIYSIFTSSIIYVLFIP